MDGKAHIITFKADDTLVEAMEGITNRSEFIRGAILSALDGACPLCRGTGVLNERQRRHWRNFSVTHEMERCGKCNVNHLVCLAESDTAEIL
ncbi:MAG: CopG family transcriptional regulator [Acidobacteria bacterium]|nr:MAG: CopG family transcriptional regulator [Acidobacteriota bacterium]RLE36491.1 MAG: CopG family transcriptional regulator [Acidobacteriota bacterium]